MKAYTRRHDAASEDQDVRIGPDAPSMRRVVECGLGVLPVAYIGHCALVEFAFLFHCRGSPVRSALVEDVTLTSLGVSARLRQRKGNLVGQPLLTYPTALGWVGSDPIALLRKCSTVRPHSRGFFDLSAGSHWGSVDLSASVSRVCSLAAILPPPGCNYSSHSCRIGSFNELFVFGFAKEWIMSRLDWSSEGMFRVYLDTRAILSPDSECFFAHFRSTR